MKVRKNGGYTFQTYDSQFKKISPRILIGSGLEARLKFDPKTNRPVETGEIDSKRLWLYYPEMGIQSVKLPADYELPKDIEDLSIIDLVKPEACIVGQEIYVRAQAIKIS